MKLDWKTKAIVLTAPFRRDLDKFIELIDKFLGPNGCNMVIIQVRYRYDFHSHPECRGLDPLTQEDIKKILTICRKHGISLVPKMNLLSHQSGLPNTPSDSILHGHPVETPDIRDGFLRAYPEFDEMRDYDTVDYCRSICLSNPAAKYIIFDLMDELLEVFESNIIHVGCDEVFNIGVCDECKKHSHAELFAGWINALHGHLAESGKKMMMWSDRLNRAEEMGYSKYEGDISGIADAIDMIPKDILLCDWHHEKETMTYPSVDEYAKKGFHMLVSPGWYLDRISRFVSYAKQHDQGHIDGILVTTWCNSGELSDCLLKGKPGIWYRTEMVAESLRFIFENK